MSSGHFRLEAIKEIFLDLKCPLSEETVEKSLLMYIYTYDIRIYTYHIYICMYNMYTHTYIYIYKCRRVFFKSVRHGLRQGVHPNRTMGLQGWLPCGLRCHCCLIHPLLFGLDPQIYRFKFQNLHFLLF